MSSTSSPNIRNLVVACAAITVFGLAFGMTYPLLSLILESRGVSESMIGINSAMMPLGILLFGSAIPFLSRRFGARNLAVSAAVLTALFIILYKVFDTLDFSSAIDSAARETFSAKLNDELSITANITSFESE